MGFSRQEYWGGLPCPPPHLPDSGIEPVSLKSFLHWQAGSLPLAPPGKPSLVSLSKRLSSRRSLLIKLNILKRRKMGTEYYLSIQLANFTVLLWICSSPLGYQWSYRNTDYIQPVFNWLLKSHESCKEKEVAAHSNVLAREIRGPRSMMGYCPWGRKESVMTWRLSNNWSCRLTPVSQFEQSPLLNCVCASGRRWWKRVCVGFVKLMYE